LKMVRSPVPKPFNRRAIVPGTIASAARNILCQDDAQMISDCMTRADTQSSILGPKALAPSINPRVNATVAGVFQNGAPVIRPLTVSGHAMTGRLWNLSGGQRFLPPQHWRTEMQDRDIDKQTTDLNRRNTGSMGGTTIAAIIAALLIAGALYTWGPWSNNSNTAANPAPSTTVGQTSTAPVATAPMAIAPAAPASPATTESPATPAPTTR
jgi:hypothetical protein